MVDQQQKLAKELSDQNPNNALLLDDNAVAVLLKAIYASPSSAPEFFSMQYKTYVELILKLAMQNPKDPIMLEQVVAAYEIFLENNLKIVESDSPNLKTFVAEMENRYSNTVISKVDRAAIADEALAALTAQ